MFLGAETGTAGAAGAAIMASTYTALLMSAR
jgi:hypothetical protein